MIKRQLLLSAALFAAVALLITGCRPSQQSRRGSTNTASRNAAASTSSAVSRSMMDSLLMVQNKLITVIDTLSNVISEDRQRIRDLEREVARLKSLLDQQQLQGGGSYNGVPMPPQNRQMNYNTAPPPHTLPVPYQAPDVTNSTPSEEYSNALKLFNAAQYEEALAAFDELAHNQPTSQYMPNFIYWRGESLYALGSYDDAITDFHQVLSDYPTSTKSDDAQFKIGASYEKLGSAVNAKAAYERLLLTNPESEYVSRAKSRLQKLK